MKKDKPHKFTDQDIADLARTFGQPPPAGFKEKVLARARAIEAAPPQPTKKRQRGIDV